MTLPKQTRIFTPDDFTHCVPLWLFGPAAQLRHEALAIVHQWAPPNPLQHSRLETLHTLLHTPCIPSSQWNETHFPSVPTLKAHPEHRRQQALALLDLVQQQQRGYTRAEHATLLDTYDLIRQPSMRR